MALPRGGRVNRWFNLETEEAEPALEAWRVHPGPLVLDVSLLPCDGPPVLLERWTFAYEPAAGPGAAARDADSGSCAPSASAQARALEVPAVYKRAVVQLRSLYALLRTLPAHRLARACADPQGAPFSLSHRLGRAPVSPLAGPDSQLFSFSAVEMALGRLVGSVVHAGNDALAVLVPPAASRGPPTSTHLAFSRSAPGPGAGEALRVGEALQRSWSRAGGLAGEALRSAPPTARIDVDAFAAAAHAQTGAGVGGRGSAPVSIPCRRPAEGWLENAERSLGGSPASADRERPFAARPPSGPASPGQPASPRAVVGGGARLLAPALRPGVPPVLMALPFALTPSAASLASGAHPLAQRPGGPGWGSGAGSPGELAARFAAALSRRPSWSPASSLALSASVAGVSPTSPAWEGCTAVVAHAHGGPRHSPVERHPWLGDPHPHHDESEAELPFALDSADRDAKDGAEGAPATAAAAHAAPRAVDAAVGHLVRMLADAPPVRAPPARCTLRDAVAALERWAGERTAMRGA